MSSVVVVVIDNTLSHVTTFDNPMAETFRRPPRTQAYTDAVDRSAAETERVDAQERWAEIRFDGAAMTVSGTAIRYGETAKLYENEFERFEPGAFGDVGGLDVILDVQHDRSRPVARTGGGGLDIRDSAASLEFEAKLADTSAGRDARELVTSGVIRGASIRFVPKRWTDERTGAKMTRVVERAELLRISLVDKPAYRGSTLKREDRMDENEIRRIVEEHVSGREQIDAGALARDLAERVGAAVETAVADLRAEVRKDIDEALRERDEAAEQARQADEAAERERQAVEQERADLHESAQRRADLLRLCDGLLPEGADAREMTDGDLLRSAVGDEVPDAAARSDDYLLAKLEGIVERRADRERADRAAAGAPVRDADAKSGSFNFGNFLAQRARR